MEVGGADTSLQAADVLDRLRVATRAAHERLDKHLDILGQLATPESRRRMVERFYGLHEGAERVLSPLLQGVAGLDYDERRRTPLLRSDLAALGPCDTDFSPTCAMTAPSTVAEALGIFYVLEGSTLGGRVIGREVKARGQSMTGLSFLDPYGPRVGERWRAFLDVLRRECPTGASGLDEEAVRGGVAGFHYAGAWLGDAKVDR